MKLGDLFGDPLLLEEVNKPKSALEDIFEEEPVSLDVFVRDQKFLKNPPLSEKQYDAVRHIERVYLPQTFDLMAKEFGGYWADPVRMTNLITLQWGKGSGKDHICRISSLRVTYLLLCLKSPQEYFSMPEQDSIHLLNIASNSGQANRAFFKPMTEAVKRGWFADKAAPTRDTIVYDKHVEAVSGHSDADAQEGMNLILGVADEIDAFKSKDEMVGRGKQAREASTSAETILDMLKTSASTRFTKSYKRVAISFPRYLGSVIQQLTEAGKKDNEEMGEASKEYVSGPWPTWEVNPRVSGKEEFADDYRKDPDAAAAKYECKPTRATDSYFRNMPLLKNAIIGPEMPLSVSYEQKVFRSKETGETTTGWDPIFHFSDGFLPVQGANYAMHADLAITGDRAGIAMSHVSRWERRVEITQDDEGGMVEEEVMLPVVRNDFTIAFESDLTRTPPREIQIRWARMLFFTLRQKGFNIVSFTYDGFQSVDSMQMLTAHGIESERLSLDINDDVYKTVKDVAYDQRLEMFYDSLLIQEIEGLSRIGNKVDHPPGGSKDLADAFGGSIQGAVKAGGEEDPEGSASDVGENFFVVGSDFSSLQGADFGGGDDFALSLPIGMDEAMGW